MTSKERIPIDKKFSISFDLSFENPNYYGYVVRILTTSFSLKLLYIQFENADTSYLQIVINDHAIPKKMAFPKNILTRGNWFSVKIILDPLTKQCILSSNEGNDVETKLNFPISESAEIIYGADYKYHSRQNEVPSMRLRNIKMLGERDELLHYWKLNETEGLVAKDSISNLDASVSNPNWMINNHYQFRNVATIGPFPKYHKYFLPQISHDEKRNRLILVSRDFTYYYDLNTRTYNRETFRIPMKHIKIQSIFNNSKKKLYTYFGGGGKVSVYDEKLKSWSKVDTCGEHNGLYYNHNSFINPLNGDLCIIGGYGWYRTKNDLQKYDFATKKWMKIQTKGDYLNPRSVAAICNKNDEGDFFIYGGVGNESGKQEETNRALYGLYLLSMKDTSIKKIGEIKNAPKEFAVFPIMHYDSEKKYLYIMGLPESGKADLTKRIYRYDLNTKSFDAVSDSLKHYDTFNYPMIYDGVNNEIYAFEKANETADSFYVSVSSLLYPPMTEKEFNNLEKTKLLTNILTVNRSVVVIFFTFVFGGGIWFYNQRSKAKTGYPVVQLSIENNPNKSLRENSIYLFGDFQVFDKMGKDITREFTPKIRQLFLLILTKSYNGVNRGISTEALTNCLWPELGVERAKNNRNVTINKLRTILSKLDGIEICNDKNFWEISSSENVYCDFCEFQSILSSTEIDAEELIKIRNILSRGELLQESSYEWLDGQKAHIVEEAIVGLKLSVMQNELNHASILAAADSILSLDSVNEDGVSMKIKAFVRLGDHQLAKKTYDLFKKEYYMLYAEEYQKSFTELLN